jgi:hypothetical protein
MPHGDITYKSHNRYAGMKWLLAQAHAVSRKVI